MSSSTATKDVEHVTKALNQLDVSKNTTTNHHSSSSSSSFQQELSKSGFRIFQNVVDLGNFGWTPKGKYRKLERTNVRDIVSMIQYPASPDTLVDLVALRKKLPIQFESPPSQKHLNKYPFDLPHVASLHVVTKYMQKRINVQSIDFILGGSGLEVLATETLPKGTLYVVCWVPHTNAIILKKHKVYPQEFADVGFQFERLVTGQEMGARHDMTQIEHLQLMDVNDKFKILFSAELDAIWKDEQPQPQPQAEQQQRVEIKASNPKHWGTKTMFQMISSGSSHLCHGRKGKGTPPTLTNVELLSLETVSKRALQKSKLSLSQLEANIVKHLSTIQTKLQQPQKEQEGLEQGQVYKIRFSNGQIELSLARGTDLLPSLEVVQQLLSITN